MLSRSHLASFRISAPLGLLTGLALVLTACALDSSQSDESVGVNFEELSFNPNNLLNDTDLTNSSSLTAAEIQTFLEKTHCGNRSALADYTSNGKTAAQAMADAAAKYKINPIEFLVRIQTESSALCQKVTEYRLDRAFGCGCPDGKQCGAAFLGFDRQVDCAAKAFRSYFDDIAQNGQTIAGWAPNKTKTSLDPIKVTPANAATAALYTYTPWVYNGGNQLHWQVWQSVVDYLNRPGIKHPDVKPGTSLGSGGLNTNSSGNAPPSGCNTDYDCNHGAPGTGLVCSNLGPERGTCIEACHSDLDCPGATGCDDTASPHWQCLSKPPRIGTECASDEDCTDKDSAAGTGRVCSAETKKCIIGCHDDKDCSGTAICDKSLKSWTCIDRKTIGEECGTDDECNGGVPGTQRICDSSSKLCIDACRTDTDCSDGYSCTKTGNKGSCEYKKPSGERDKAIQRAEMSRGFSYWWGHGRFSTEGSTLKTSGSCSGSCPNCKHKGQYGGDCSGLAAKVWQVPASNNKMDVDSHPYSTANFAAGSSQWSGIKRSELLAADELVYNTNGRGHIFVFESFSSGGGMWAYECKGCAAGCVHNVRKTVSATYKSIRKKGW